MSSWLGLVIPVIHNVSGTACVDPATHIPACARTHVAEHGCRDRHQPGPASCALLWEDGPCAHRRVQPHSCPVPPRFPQGQFLSGRQTTAGPASLRKAACDGATLGKSSLKTPPNRKPESSPGLGCCYPSSLCQLQLSGNCCQQESKHFSADLVR